MLVTTCRHCAARFRVTPEQLNLRQGLVRCGECEQVFNGFESLERFPGDDTATRLLAVRAGRLKSADPMDTLEEVDLGRTPGDAPPADEKADGEQAPGPLPDSPPSLRAFADDLEDPPDPATLVGPAPGQDLPPPQPETAEPVAPVAPAASTPARTPPREVSGPDPYPAVAERPSRAWSFGLALLLLVLGVQLAYAFRARIAQHYPALRPVLESACASAGCTVPWVNDESALKLEDSELLEVPGKPGQIALSARIRNLASSAQEYPHLELTLTDVTGQAAVRRVLRPADYLGREPSTGEVLASGGEMQLSVRLELARVKATGYELLLFYP